jgi:hypothetical protein
VLAPGLALLLALSAASPALAATSGSRAGVAVALLGPVGDLLGGLTHAVLGGVDWTVNVAGDFILNLLGGLIKDLIPRSWIHKGLDIMGWLVAVPDYTGQVSTPGGGHAYGFAGVNAMRSLYLWLGMAIAPLTLVYATARSWSGQGDPPHVPLTRVFVVAIALLNYGWLWSQAVALTNQITHAILAVPAVTSGVQKMFEVLIAGAALGGLPLIGLLLMGAGGLQLIVMIFVKVTLILIGALVFAIGPLMIGLVPTERGNAFARAWLTMAAGLFVLPVLWASIFAISAVLISDASSGASVIGGSSGLDHVLGGLLIGLAAIAGFWLNIKLAKGFAGLVGGQLAGLLALAGGGARALLGGAGSRFGGGGGGAASSAAGAAGSLRGFASKVGGAVSGAAGALVPAGRAGAVLAGAGGAAATLARGGLIGAGGALASKGIAGAARSGVGQAAASSRAGTVATRAARGARRGWGAATPSSAAASTGSAPGGTGSSGGTVTLGDRTYSADAWQQLADAPQSPFHARAAAIALEDKQRLTGGAREAQVGGGLAGHASATLSQGAPGGRPRTPSSPTPTRPGAGTSARSSAPRPADGVAKDSGNDAARQAFGQPSASKPTRRARQRFKRGPRA